MQSINDPATTVGGTKSLCPLMELLYDRVCGLNSECIAQYIDRVSYQIIFIVCGMMLTETTCVLIYC